MNKDKNQLYEELISCISYSVKYELNEAYENALLEEYGFKEIMSQIYDGASKTSKVLFKQIRSLLIYLIERLEKTNQYKKNTIGKKMMNSIELNNIYFYFSANIMLIHELAKLYLIFCISFPIIFLHIFVFICIFAKNKAHEILCRYNKL